MDEKIILAQIKESVKDAIKSRLEGYNSPLNPFIDEALENNKEGLRKVFHSAFEKVVSSEEFKEAVITAFHHRVAKMLVSKLSGSVEKAVNALRQDQATQARMILAIENIVEENAKKED